MTTQTYKGSRWIRRNDDGMLDHESRRLGKYHTGSPTKVVSARLPADKHALAAEKLSTMGITMSEWIEYQIDSQLLRQR